MLFLYSNGKEVDFITNQELNTRLYQKMFDEQEHYRQHLLTLPPAEILYHAYEYTTLELFEGRSWREDHLLSLAGVFVTKRENVVPVALSRYLADHPDIQVLRLHLDNDAIGRGAAAGIVGGLRDRYEIWDEPPRWGKDVNDQLKIRVGLKRKEEYSR